jgi:hypothetical protein
VIVGRHGTKAAGAGLLCRFGSETAIPSPLFSNSKSHAASFGRASRANGTVARADKAVSRDNAHERFEVKGSNRQTAYSLDGACADMAAKCFNRLRLGEAGIQHLVAGPYLLRDAQESSRRQQTERWPALT